MCEKHVTTLFHDLSCHTSCIVCVHDSMIAIKKNSRTFKENTAPATNFDDKMKMYLTTYKQKETAATKSLCFLS